jgi:hypothetical protein
MTTLFGSTSVHLRDHLGEAVDDYTNVPYWLDTHAFDDPDHPDSVLYDVVVENEETGNYVICDGVVHGAKDVEDLAREIAWDIRAKLGLKGPLGLRKLFGKLNSPERLLADEEDR